MRRSGRICAPTRRRNRSTSVCATHEPRRKRALVARPDGAPLQLWQFEQSSDLAAIVDPERRQQRIDAGVVPFDTVENEARASGTAHFTALRDQASVAAAAWQALSEG